MPIPLLVTRAAEDAEALAARLGPHAIPAPCLAWEDTEDEPPDLAGADLLVTSPRGARAVARIPPFREGPRVLALAPATSAALRALGLPVDVEIEGGAADLARAAHDGRVVFVTSDLGGDEVWKVRPDAIRWVAYRTACPDALPPAALAALDGPFDVLFASPSAVRNFERLAPGALIRARRVLCHGATTLAAARAAGADPLPFSLPRA